MPVSSPPLNTVTLSGLAELGKKIRARREELGLTMNQAAGAAGVSRVTVHRIERGTPSVTMGAYLNVITALGLSVDLNPDPSGATIRIGDYPQLRLVAWQLAADTEISEADALQLYERNWRHTDHAALQDGSERSCSTSPTPGATGGPLFERLPPRSATPISSNSSTPTGVDRRDRRSELKGRPDDFRR